MEEVLTKVCSKCNKEKPLLHFGIDKQKKDGRRPDCRKCRKKTKQKKRGYYNHSKTRKRKPKPRHRSTREYDFLKYTRLIFKWATKQYDISRPDLEVILYLYGEGAFPKNKFIEFYRVVSMHQNHHFNRFVKNNWIVLWRPRRNNESALYVLSNKMKSMCSRMHRICTGEEEIPMSPRYNNLAKDSNRNSTYYLQMIKRMNDDK